ncbi:hypothetical protein [Mesorhizobium sp. 43Arga]
MKIIRSVSTGEISDCKAGTLIALFQEGGALGYAIKLDTSDTEAASLAVLKSFDGSPPHFLRIHPVNDCLIFGDDWAFEIVTPRGDEKTSDSETPGTVIISGDRTFLRLGRDPVNIRSTGGYVDLDSLKPVISLPSFKLSVQRWRVWENANEVGNPNKTPLMSFGI